MITTKFYVDNLGNYIGGFAGTPPPAGSIEVSIAPDDASQKWDFVNKKFLAATPNPIDSVAAKIKTGTATTNDINTYIKLRDSL